MKLLILCSMKDDKVTRQAADWGEDICNTFTC